MAELQRSKPVAIICDLVMPNMDGRQLLKRLKSSPKYNDIPFVIVSSLINEAERAALCREGASQVLGKPVRPTDLSRILAGVLATGGA